MAILGQLSFERFETLLLRGDQPFERLDTLLLGLNSCDGLFEPFAQVSIRLQCLP